MARYTTIPISEIIVSTKFQLQLTNTTEFDDFFELFGREAVRHLYALSIYIKRQCKLSIQDSKSELPCDFYKLVGLRFHRTTNTDGSQSCFNILYADTKFLNNCGCNINQQNTTNFWQSMQIVGRFIHYNTPITQLSTTVDISYIALNQDEDGQLIVYEEYERAVRSYMAYRFTLAFHEKYPVNVRMEYKKEWMAQKAFLKGVDAQNNFQNEKRQVDAIYTALLASPILNY